MLFKTNKYLDTDGELKGRSTDEPEPPERRNEV